MNAFVKPMDLDSNAISERATKAWYDRKGRSKSAAILKFVILEGLFSRCLHVCGNVVHFLDVVWSPSGVKGLLETYRISSF